MESENRNSTEPQQTSSKRPVWTNSIEFLMSCICTSVGLGNVWRFPFIAYENGGGAFLIPYIIVLFLIGKPVYYMEMIIGQFTSRSSIKMYEISPIFRGVGVGQMIAITFIMTYYCTLICTTLFYMVASFSSELPWAKCIESWGSNCVDAKPNQTLELVSTSSSYNVTQAQSSSELYYLNEVLHQINDVSGGLGFPNWPLVICLLISWVVLCLVILRGVKSSGKASYFLALFPYIIMITLLVRAVTLEGAVDGIMFFLRPKWSELLNVKVWKEAIVQLFYSLAVGMGSIVMYSSYNTFDHNIYRDAMIVTTLDTFTSLMAGLTIFGVLGNLAHNLKIDNINEVVKSGSGLAFISYPDAIAKFDWMPQIFAVLFFVMMFVLGIGSVVALQSALVSAICDQFTRLRFWAVAIVTAVLCFGLGLVYITPGGQWMLNLVDVFGGTLLIFSLAMLEIIAVFWIYGIENFCWDVEYMTGRKTSIYWRFCWVVISPIFMTFIFFNSFVTLEPIKYSGWEYPQFLVVLGWSLFIFGFIMFPLFAIHALYPRKGASLWSSICKAFAPSDAWGPADQKHYLAWKQFKADALQRRKKQAADGNHSWLTQKFFILFGRYR